MELAIDFQLHNEDWEAKASEINILYKSDHRIEDLIAFLSKYKNTHIINIEFQNGVEPNIMKVAANVHPRVRARLKSVDINKIQTLQEKEIKYFFDSEMPAYNLTTLDSLISLGVTDVYIADDLMYNLPEVYAYCAAHNVRTRLILNRIPATTMDKGINPRSPIFSPLTKPILDLYIDVAEFDCGRHYSWPKLGVLYRAWFENQKWIGDLREINDDLLLPISTPAYFPEWVNYKIKCGRHCCAGKKVYCHKCGQFLEIAKNLKGNNIGIKFERAKNNNQNN